MAQIIFYNNVQFCTWPIYTAADLSASPFFALGNDPANLELGQCRQLQNLAPLEAFFCTSKGTVHMVNNQFLQLHILAPLADIFCTSNGASLYSTWPICTAAAISAPLGHFLH